MKMKRNFAAAIRMVLAGIVLLWAGAVLAEEDPETVGERLDRLEKEVQQLRSAPGDLPPEPAPEKSEGAAPRLTFHGYGELHYNHPAVEGTGLPEGSSPPTLDFHRFALGWTWYFNDPLSLHAEIDFEHAAQEIELEFAYLEYRWTDAVGFRAGSLLLPVGPLNEFHEPTLFYSVERPYVDQYIIPTTWNAGGAGAFGQPFPGIEYEIYWVEGLDASRFRENGIAESQPTLSEDTNRAYNFGGVGRVAYTGLPGFLAGASLYGAGAAQGDPVIGHAQVTLWEADLKYRFKGMDLAALYARTHIGGADRISARVGETVGSEQFGGYLEGAYHLAPIMKTEWDLVPFVRWEKINTQADVPAGLPRNPATDRRVLTYGLAYYPHPDVAIKGDREAWRDETGADESRTNLAVAFMF